MRKWRLPLTYEPKIEPVLLGTCRQTIRMGRKKQVGDLIRFFVWTGKPYRSKQIDLTEYEPLTGVWNVKIIPIGIIFTAGGLIPWNFTYMNDIAARDGIVPPTGEALRDVLIGKNGKIPAEGIDAQILRW
jgi:hypothetical protein